GHSAQGFKRPDVPRLTRPKINQRIRVHVATKMKVSAIILRENDCVMAVPPHLLRQPDLPPSGFLSLSARDRHCAVLIVVSNKLPAAAREESESHRMPGPCPTDINGFARKGRPLTGINVHEEAVHLVADLAGCQWLTASGGLDE